MKNFTKTALSLILFVMATMWTFNYTHKSTMVSKNQAPSEVDTLPKKDTKKKKLKSRRGLTSFLDEMGRLESSGQYTVVSKTGHLGKYQFHPRTLRSIGVDVSIDQFLHDPQLQDSIMIVWMKSNSKSLRGIIKKYHGSYFNGIYITKAGILAGAHLVGVGGVLSFFYPDKYQFNTADGNGVHVSRYIEQFANYDLKGL